MTHQFVLSFISTKLKGKKLQKSGHVCGINI